MLSNSGDLSIDDLSLSLMALDNLSLTINLSSISADFNCATGLATLTSIDR